MCRISGSRVSGLGKNTNRVALHKSATITEPGKGGGPRDPRPQTRDPTYVGGSTSDRKPAARM